MTRLCTYTDGRAAHVGVLIPDSNRVRPLDHLVSPEVAAISGVAALIDVEPQELSQGADHETVRLADVTLLAPIPRPSRNIFCVGKNYLDHVTEFGRSGYDTTVSSDTPSHPIIFTKLASCVVGPHDDVESHPGATTELDYEAEVAVIIGRSGRNIAAGQADQHVWGYTLVNDVTARDLQRQHKQWFLGKSLDSFCPMGPWMATADELDLSDVRLEARVNGELRQSASTADMIFDVPKLIETISAGRTLEAGDVIATGTPAGVGIGFDPPRFLAVGDLVEISATGLGLLANRIT